MNKRLAFEEAVPDGYYLDATDRAGLTRFLERHQWLDPHERITAVSPAGDGNMNCTLRVVTDRGSFILKQSRPWVEKYPQIAAPVDRALQEGAFYALVADCPPVADMMPRLLGVNRTSRMLKLTDLGEAADHTWMYEGRAITISSLDRLLGYLSELHRCFVGSERTSEFTNRDMRRLNHQHLFEVPLSPAGPGFALDSLTPGLSAAAQRLKGDQDYCAKVAALGRVYLAEGTVLLHGDFFPGSWVSAEGKVWVIDPEFSFFGPPEFDVGVLMAHIILTKQPGDIVQRVVEGYRPAGGFEPTLAAQWAGVEIMRRLIGVAQLPVSATLEEKEHWLERSRRLVCGREPWGTG